MTRRVRLVLASVGVVVAAPCVLTAAMFVAYAFGYHGVCEAHPLDIPARACTRGEYLSDWLGDDFSVVGLIVIDATVLGVMAVVVGVAWAVAVVVRRRRV